MSGLREKQTNGPASDSVSPVINGKVSGIGCISEPGVAKTGGGALLHAAIAQHDIAGAHNIPGRMHFCGPGDSLRPVADTSTASADERPRPLSIGIDNCIRPARVFGVR